MNRFTFAALAALLSLAVQAVPSLTDVSATKMANGKLRVAYLLGNDPAVVTLALYNSSTGEKIDESLYNQLEGEVNCLVQPDAAAKHKFFFSNTTGLSDAQLDVRLRAWPVSCPPDYVVISLTNTSETVRYYVGTNAFPESVGSEKYKTTHLVMRKIPAANVEFEMGVTSLEWGSNSSTAPHHYAILSEDYYIGIYEMTYGQYIRAIGVSSYAQGYWKTGTNEFTSVRKQTWPVGAVSYGQTRGLMHENNSAYPTGTPGVSGSGGHTGNCSTSMEGYVRYYNWPRDGHTLTPNLSARCACTMYPGAYQPDLGKMRDRYGFEFDLPTEAQWEYACRAGSFGRSYTKGFYCSADKTSYTGRTDECPYDIDEYSWNYCNSSNASLTLTRPLPHEVGLKKPNAFGLYDMLGNAWEMCLDYYLTTTYPKSGEAVTDPEGADTGEGLVYRSHNRTLRGGSVNSELYCCRPGYRGYSDPASLERGVGMPTAETAASKTGAGLGYSYNVGFRVAAPASAAR